MALLKFQSMEAFDAWYGSDGYAPLAHVRQSLKVDDRAPRAARGGAAPEDGGALVGSGIHYLQETQPTRIGAAIAERLEVPS